MDPVWPLPGIEEVVISAAGVFKYILIEVYLGDLLLGMLVRGDKQFQYHRDNFKALQENLKTKGYKDITRQARTIKAVDKKTNKLLKFICVGGGRIENKPK